MTELLRKAVATVEALPPEHQDFYAQVLLEEVQSERRWEELFSRPIEGTKLEQLLTEAERDIRDGRTVPMRELVGEDEPEDDSAPLREPKR